MSINAVYEDSQGNVHESRMDGVDLTTKISIADDFSASVNYAVGDFCYHLGTLYKCTTAHTAGAWNAAHFTATQVGDEIGELKNDITNVGNMRMTKLWENQNPTAEFAAQNITLLSSDYDLLLLVCRLSSTYAGTSSYISPKGMGGKWDLASYALNGSENWIRYTEYVDDTTINIRDAYSVIPNQTGVVTNTLLIPYQIYGIKLT